MTRVRLSWPANPANELVTAYKVWEGYANPANPSLVQTVDTNSVELDLAPGRYAWAVSAVNLAGESIKSSFTYSPNIPSQPGTVTIEILTP